jgi:hypothetical protein
MQKPVNPPAASSTPRWIASSSGFDGRISFGSHTTAGEGTRSVAVWKRRKKNHLMLTALT